MAKRQPVLVNGEELSSGVFLLDKPTGVSSFFIVKKVRYLLGIKKVGHAGTLDPFASGLLVICAGRSATRHIEQFMQGRKRYEACLQLGAETSTMDPEGERISSTSPRNFTLDELQTLVEGFLGPQLQAPPPFSAAKYKGKPLYYYARKGINIEKEPKSIEVFSIDILDYDPVQHQVKLDICCSRGTYIRVLASDMGKQLGCGAYLQALRRTASGTFSVDQAIAGERLQTEEGLDVLLSGILSVEEALAPLAQNNLDDSGQNS